MKLCTVATCGVLALAGCASHGPAPAELAAQSAVAPRIYVEAVLLRVPNEQVGTLGGRSLADLASRRDGSVLGAPHALLDDRRQAQFAFGEPSPSDGEALSYHWTCEPSVLNDGRVRLGITIAAEEVRLAHTTVVLADGQSVVAPTSAPGRPGEALVLVVRPEIVRSQEDLRAILDRKMRSR
jgi:hypothetical protein